MFPNKPLHKFGPAAFKILQIKIIIMSFKNKKLMI
jgi:hypothetical protein